MRGSLLGVICPGQPDTLIWCRSFYNPPWLQPCQRRPGFRHDALPWIPSHWNIECQVNFRPGMAAGKAEHLDNPMMSGGEQLLQPVLTCQTDLYSTLPFASDSLKNCWNQTTLFEPWSYFRLYCSICCTEWTHTLSSNMPTEFALKFGKKCLGCQWVWYINMKCGGIPSFAPTRYTKHQIWPQRCLQTR